ncbi:MAG: hypothetical protein GY940_37695 [bacterium]|nr:hypothetical protein [bacterium]
MIEVYLKTRATHSEFPMTDADRRAEAIQNYLSKNAIVVGTAGETLEETGVISIERGSFLHRSYSFQETLVLLRGDWILPLS